MPHQQQTGFGSGTSTGFGFADPRGFLEETPRAAFFSFAPQFGGQGQGGQSPLQQNYFQNAFQQIQDQFLGSLGQQALAGQAPTGNFTNFLQDFPFTQQFTALPPQQRGEFNSRFAPRTRRLFF